MKFTKQPICTNGGRVGNADNMWCSGSSTILRVGEDVFFTHTRLIEERTGWNCNSFELYASRGGGAWQREYADEGIYQRSPCPILYLGGSLIGVTVNPGDCSEGADAFGPAGVPAYITSTPMLYVFDISGPAKPVRRLTLRWDDPAYWFIQHSYRSHVTDTVTGELFFTNEHYDCLPEAICYTMLDKDLRYLRSGRFDVPWRFLYHTMCLQDGEFYAFGIRGIEEPVEEWKAFKRQATGDLFDYEFRNIFLLYSPDIRTGTHREPLLVASRDATCGRVDGHDAAFDADGSVWFLYSASHDQKHCMRDTCFPGLRLEKTLELVHLNKGGILSREVIDVSDEQDGCTPHTEYGAALHTMPDGSLRLLWSKRSSPAGDTCPDGLYLYDLTAKTSQRISDEAPGAFFISRRRLGAQPDTRADLVWLDRYVNGQPADPRLLHHCFLHDIPVTGQKLQYQHGVLEL